MRHGFLLVAKPKGPTSHDVVAMVRKALGERKVGHLGTLDPAASGLMVLAVGAKALKVVEFFKDLGKEYEAEVRFGSVSSTYDGEGTLEQVEPKPGWNVPDQHAIKELIVRKFTGTVSQVPPAHSAVHVDGKRAYELARKGEMVEMPLRSVTIDSCEILTYEYPVLTLRVACSSGTYIRTLAHDIGQESRFGAYLSALKRTKVGSWNLDDACPPKEVDWTNVIPLKEVMAGFESLELSDSEAEDVSHGRAIERQVKKDCIAWHSGLPIAVMVPLKDGSNACRPRKVL